MGTEPINSDEVLKAIEKNMPAVPVADLTIVLGRALRGGGIVGMRAHAIPA